MYGRLSVIYLFCGASARSRDQRLRSSGRMRKINRPIVTSPTLSAKPLKRQVDWPVNLAFTGPICARALNLRFPLRLGARGHHDWPVNAVIQELTAFGRRHGSSQRFAGFHVNGQTPITALLHTGKWSFRPSAWRSCPTGEASLWGVNPESQGHQPSHPALRRPSMM